MQKGSRKRINLGENVDKEVTLKELYEEHLAYCETRRLSKYTLDTYKRHYSILSQCLGDDYNVSEASMTTVQTVIKALGEKFSDKLTTINSRLKYLRTLLYYAMEQGYCRKFQIKMLNCPQKNKTPLTSDEVEKLLAKPKTQNYTETRGWVIANLVMATGIRSRNVREVKVSDLNIKDKTLYLRDTKSHKPQTIYLTNSITKILAEWLKLTGFKGEVPLFPTVYGEEMNLHVLKRAFSDYAQSRGVKTSLHILRHTYARDLARADVNPVIIKELLGHSSLEVTQRYINLFGEDVRKATDGLDNLAQYQKSRVKLGGNK